MDIRRIVERRLEEVQASEDTDEIKDATKALVGKEFISNYFLLFLAEILLQTLFFVLPVQIELAGRRLVTRLRINQLVDDQSWKPGIPPRRVVDVVAAEAIASRWKTTVSDKVGMPRNSADAMLKKLLNKK